jgi:uncharacterized oxidoreductase
MDLSNNTVLITGGGSGIGFALAEQFIKAGSEVIVCGRRMDKLEEARAKLPGLHIRQCDVSDKSQRENLFEWTKAQFPDLNVLVNNAGIQLRHNFLSGVNVDAATQEVQTNLLAPIHFCELYISGLLNQRNPVIINISSGLGFVPIARMPVYCATKAAIHSFTWSLRHQLKDTPIQVFEVIPPTVDTELDHGTRPASFRGISVHDFIVEAIEALKNDVLEAPIGEAKNLYQAARSNPEPAFMGMNH